MHCAVSDIYNYPLVVIPLHNFHVHSSCFHVYRSLLYLARANLTTSFTILLSLPPRLLNLLQCNLKNVTNSIPPLPSKKGRRSKFCPNDALRSVFFPRFLFNLKSKAGKKKIFRVGRRKSETCGRGKAAHSQRDQILELFYAFV